jgi:methyltransferase (TIGR00027 family)
MRAIVTASIFRMIQVAWSPLAVIGYVLFVARLITFSRTSRVSSTTLASLYTRWMQHGLGTRLDEPCVRLMTALPNVSGPALRLTTGGTLLAHRLTGWVPRIYRYPYEGDPPMAHQPAYRTTFFDTALARHLGSVGQLVVLGAGWDTRSYRMPAALHCFEVDTPPTQEAKRRMLRRVGLDTTRITFVPADLMTDDWLDRLVRAGFDPGRPAFFLWEAVTMYLDREAVERTLRRIAGTSIGSAVAFDYLSAEHVEARSLFMTYVRAFLRVTGEPWRFGLEGGAPSRRHADALVRSCGLSLEDHRSIGRETDRRPAQGGFVVAIVPSP